MKAIGWFFALAFAGTWALQFTFIALGLPMMSPLAIVLLALAAVVPSTVAVILNRRTGEGDEVRSLWGPPGRAGEGWVVLALVASLALTCVAVGLLMASGMPMPGIGVSAMALATLVIASFGEELGWRGFAYQRLIESLGTVRASIVVGVLWGLWHLPTEFYSPDPSAPRFALFVIQVTAASVIIAWLMERAGRRTIIAIAFHAGNYLTLFRLPHTLTAIGVRTGVFVAVAVLAGLALHRESQRSNEPIP